jgi:hypothetical protein
MHALLVKCFPFSLLCCMQPYKSATINVKFTFVHLFISLTLVFGQHSTRLINEKGYVLPPFHNTVRLTFVTLSLTARLVKIFCSNIVKFKSL